MQNLYEHLHSLLLSLGQVLFLCTLDTLSLHACFTETGISPFTVFLILPKPLFPFSSLSSYFTISALRILSRFTHDFHFLPCMMIVAFFPSLVSVSFISVYFLLFPLDIPFFSFAPWNSFNISESFLKGLPKTSS
jgi:hypothetical protein